MITCWRLIVRAFIFYGPFEKLSMFVGDWVGDIWGRTPSEASVFTPTGHHGRCWDMQWHVENTHRNISMKFGRFYILVLGWGFSFPGRLTWVDYTILSSMSAILFSPNTTGVTWLKPWATHPSPHHPPVRAPDAPVNQTFVDHRRKILWFSWQRMYNQKSVHVYATYFVCKAALKSL